MRKPRTPRPNPSAATPLPRLAHTRTRATPLSHSKLPWLTALAFTLLFVALTTAFEGEAPGWTAFDDIGELLAAACASAACVVRARRERSLHASLWELRRSDRTRSFEVALQRQTWIAWTLLTVGVSLWAVGQAGWSVYEVGLGATPPSPSWLDILFLGSPVLIVAGLLAMVRTPAGRLSHVRGAAEAVFIAVGFLLLSWTALGPAIVSSKAPALSEAVNLAYPTLDAMALAAVLFVALRRAGDPPPGLGLLAAGIVCVALSDSAFWYLSAHGSVAGATPLDSGWVAGFLLIALAALRRGCGRSIYQRLARRRLLLIVPAVPVAAGAFALAAGWLVDGSILADEVPLGILGVLALFGAALIVAISYENRVLVDNLEDVVRERTSELRANERYYRALVKRSSDMVMVVDGELKIRYVSDSVRSTFGRPPAELVGARLDAFGEEASQALAQALERSTLAPEQPLRVKWALTDGSGRLRAAESTITNLLSDEQVRGFVLNTRDDTERAALEEQLRHQALHDPLTGLANRALLADRARQAFLRSRRTGGSVAVMALDIDSFKHVNERMGHQAGDELLRAVAQRLSETFRPEDTVARTGGDEFVVLLDAAPSGQLVQELAERVLEALRAPFELAGEECEVTASVGVAIDGAPHNNLEQLLSDADVAMYAVKTGGRDGVRLFEASMHKHARERLELQSDLREGLKRDELWLLYQPEFGDGGTELEGFEALVRWNHPTHGLLGPDRFIPLAEETGLIVPLGRWVLQEALRHAAAWPPADGGRPLTISVNLSTVQLGSPSLISDVRAALEQSGIDPARLVLEITESALIDSSDHAVEVLRELKALGVRLAIDDFGTGYASIAYLQKIPLDVLKVDRSFVTSSEDGERGRELLETIVNIGRALSLETVAEGVEQPSQLATVTEVGCDLVQGYLLGRPLSEKGARALIAERRSDRGATSVAATAAGGS
jgi:diguanylate cyclase (GGDEF)-like protein/PAS domain S-box-containing protein